MTPTRSSAADGWPMGTFMARLTDKARKDLLMLKRPQRFLPETVLLTQGESSQQVYLLRSATLGTSACVKVSARLANGTEALLGIRVSGDVVGELAGLRGSSRNATVTTCSP